MFNKILISETRNYIVTVTEQAKAIVKQYLIKNDFDLSQISFGLPEIIDRYHNWNVPILFRDYFTIGDVMIDAYTGEIDVEKSSELIILAKKRAIIDTYQLLDKDSVVKAAYKFLDNRRVSSKVKIVYDDIKLVRKDIQLDEWHVGLLTEKNRPAGQLVFNAYTGALDDELSFINLNNTRKKKEYPLSPLGNLIIKGDSTKALYQLPEESIDLIFTSPPYYNAKKEYSEYASYDEYLETMRKVIKACKRVLIGGKFFVMNTSHVMIPRASRSESSRRITVPFDLHQIFLEEGFEFVDDIIWQKPEGAGWASGRGRRFSADRNAMQYKAVPVTEYVMVYRKKSTHLIDYFIRNHPNQEIVEQSKILGEYDVTNIWYLSPDRDKRHPAIFPRELAKKVIKYYSFKGDIVLDPFAGLGTTGKAALELNRKYCLVERDEKYMHHIRDDFQKLKNLFTSDYQFHDWSNIDTSILERYSEESNFSSERLIAALEEKVDLKELAEKMGTTYDAIIKLIIDCGIKN